MKEVIYTIKENTKVSRDVFRMVLEGDTGAITGPGQFLNIKLTGRYLRRPISIHDVNDEAVTILYKVVGHGTEDMCAMKPGEKLDVLVGLGNGFDVSCAGKAPLVIGGGIGVAPMYLTAKRLVEAGCDVTAILGFRSKEECYYEEEFKALGCKVIITTEDGSYGVKGFVTHAIPETYSYVYTCGPEPMLKAVYRATEGPGQFSFEERMGCGFGACMGCTCKTLTGYKRICKDGPVMLREEILWEK